MWEGEHTLAPSLSALMAQSIRTAQPGVTLTQSTDKVEERNTTLSKRFIQLTQPEIAEAFQRNPLVIIPTGSVEQHGPHLPTGTDYYASLGIAEKVAERLDGLVLPFCPFGVTPMHMPYEGTITLSPDTFQKMLVEVAGSAATHGARELIIMNWHEGNIPSIALAADRLQAEYGMSVLVVQACYVAEEMFGKMANGLTHGGEIEVWSVMCVRPELVHLDRVTGSSDRIRGAEADRIRRTRTYQPVLRDIRVIAPTGWYGDPVKATPEKAAEFSEAIAVEIAQRARDILQQLSVMNRL